MTLTAAQEANASLQATRPIYLIELEHSGTVELYSTSGDVVYDSRTFTGGGANLSSISNTREVTLEVPWSPERMTEIQGGQYRGGVCKIWYIPATPDDSSIFSASDGVLLIDGEIRSSRFAGNRVTITATHINNSAVYSPRNTLDEVTSYAAPPGYQIKWEGEIIVLEASR